MPNNATVREEGRETYSSLDGELEALFKWYGRIKSSDNRSIKVSLERDKRNENELWKHTVNREIINIKERLEAIEHTIPFNAVDFYWNEMVNSVNDIFSKYAYVDEVYSESDNSNVYLLILHTLEDKYEANERIFSDTIPLYKEFPMINFDLRIVSINNVDSLELSNMVLLYSKRQ